MSYALIREAIVKKKAVHFTYNDLHREMCPHVIGTKNGKEQSLMYQYGGESGSRAIAPVGSPANWRCIEIEKVSDVVIVEDPWCTADDHSRAQTCVSEIDVEVDY